MKKLIATILATIITTSTFAGDIMAMMERNLKVACEKGDHTATANWQQAIAARKAAKLTEEQTKLVTAQNNVVTVYGNIIESAPAVLQMMQYYNSCQTHPDGELNDVIGMLKVMLNLTTRPITADELKPVIDSIIQREKKIEAEHRAWLKNRK